MANNDYILRDNAINALTVSALLRNMDSVEDGTAHRYRRAAERIIAGVPAADVEAVRHGHWFMYAYDEAICSECGYDRGTEFESTKEAKERWDELPMWCEGCGAKMDEEEGGDE